MKDGATKEAIAFEMEQLEIVEAYILKLRSCSISARRAEADTNIERRSVDAAG